ncbi:MAG: tetratricopeptide repeat protein [Kiritimatiellae bacterium]|nr:tetratricopeptide repeat protein [Kiritimatiellia bacterium]
MKIIQSMSLFALLSLLTATPLFAGMNYAISLKMGDEYRGSGDFDLALEEYGTALTQASNDTEKGLALAKKAIVYAYDKKDYVAAKNLAQQTLDMGQLEAVARVTALDALAQCQMKADQNYVAAAATLEEATKLKGVDWALPFLTLSLGDCYRFSGDFDKAVKVFESVTRLESADDAIKGVAYLNIGQTEQYSLQNSSAAKKAYKKAAEMNPGLQGEVDGHLSKLP